MSRQLGRALGLVATAAVASHLTALGGGFVWLDHAHIETQLAIAPPAGWLDLFRHGFAGTGYYRPLTALSLSADALSGSVFVFHLTTLLWHALAAVLVVVAAEALGLSRRAATLAGVFFAVHPASALVAGAIAFRSEAMVACALLVLVAAHVRGRAWIAGAAIVCGALTKETAFVLAPLFVLALGRARWQLLLVEGTALSGAFALRACFAPAWRAEQVSLSVGDAIGTRLASLAKSVALVVFPLDRSICDAFPVTHAWQPTALAGAVALGALGWGAWRRRGVALLLALAVLPSLQLVPVTRWWSPHYVYIALAFFAMLLAETVERFRGVAFALPLLGALTLWDSRRFASDASLWTPEVAKSAACREGQFYLGEVAREARSWDAAAKRYEAALAAYGGKLAYVDRGATLQNLGIVRVEQHRFGDARRAFAEALAGTAESARRRELTHDLAAATLSDGDPLEAMRLLEAEVARPDALPASVALYRLAQSRR